MKIKSIRLDDNTFFNDDIDDIDDDNVWEDDDQSWWVFWTYFLLPDVWPAT